MAVIGPARGDVARLAGGDERCVVVGVDGGREGGIEAHLARDANAVDTDPQKCKLPTGAPSEDGELLEHEGVILTRREVVLAVSDDDDPEGQIRLLFRGERIPRLIHRLDHAFGDLEEPSPVSRPVAMVAVDGLGGRERDLDAEVVTEGHEAHDVGMCAICLDRVDVPVDRLLDGLAVAPHGRGRVDDEDAHDPGLVGPELEVRGEGVGVGEAKKKPKKTEHESPGEAAGLNGTDLKG